MEKNLPITERLKSIASFLPEGAYFADIGSDHAYLPCYKCLRDPASRAIAGEVNEGPYERAKKTVHAFKLEKQIDVRLGDGFDILTAKDAVKQVVIAGMGGSLITSILENGKQKLKTVERIIVQPNVDERGTRKWLHQHQYSIVAEMILEEKGHIYEIIVADKKAESLHLTEEEYLFGPVLLRNQTEIFRKKWQQRYDKLQQIIEQMKKANIINEKKVAWFEMQLKMVEEVLNNGKRT